MKVVGLTGGIASGKSFVTSILENLGAFVIDADEVYHSLLDTKKITDKFKAVFGIEFFDDNGKIDRRKLGRHVFSHPEALKKLNAITHPVVREKINDILARARSEQAPLAILSVPLLFEVGLDKEVEEVIVIFVERDTQIERLCRRSNLTIEEAIKRIDSQMSLQEKEKRASYIIKNGASRAETETQVRELYKKLTNRTC